MSAPSTPLNRTPNGARQIAPYGSWRSPVSAELIASAGVRLGQLAFAGTDIFWSEGRPQEGGRNVVVQRCADGTRQDLTPAPANVRTRVHEYGGGAFVVLGSGDALEIVYAEDADQRLHRIRPGGMPAPLTHGQNLRYADAAFDARRQRLIAVREDHREPKVEAVNTLVAVDLSTGDEQVLVEGADFVSSPRISPDGLRLAWLSWNHPDMPWDATTLWLADFDARGTLGPAVAVAGGGHVPVSIFQPEWSPTGELHFIADFTGWWNVQRWRDGEVQALLPLAADFGRAQWAFGMSTYGFDARGRIVCSCTEGGLARLMVLDPATGQVDPVDTPFNAFEEVRVGPDFVVLSGAGADCGEAIVRIDLGTGAHEVLMRASPATLDAARISVGQPIRFPAAGGGEAHAYHYRPTSPDHQGPPGEPPPLIVISHGGPTSATTPGFKWSIQYWTSRGFAVVDVNYGGSTGYGRAYRERLKGRWGEVDVDDCIAAARYLVEQGEANAGRIAIRGGSAGGYTTLCALTFRAFFKAGASLYGVGDLAALARDTHKFESRYLDSLVGPYPQAEAVYRARSPVHHVDRLAVPMILFQGAEDRAVPPNQAEAMYQAVRAKGLPVAYLLFEGEQHGFRRAETIRRVLEAEFYFYGRIFGFTPADDIAPVDIVNLPPAG